MNNVGISESIRPRSNCLKKKVGMKVYKEAKEWKKHISVGFKIPNFGCLLETDPILKMVGAIQYSSNS